MAQPQLNLAQLTAAIDWQLAYELVRSGVEPSMSAAKARVARDPRENTRTVLEARLPNAEL